MGGKARELEALIGQYAARQHGAVTRRQLLTAGVAPAVVDRRIRIGAFTVMFRGVYLAGHGPPPPLARECAAVLACAPHALLDHWTAAGLTGVCPRWRGDVHLTVVGRQIRGQKGLAVRSVDSIRPAELRRHEGIPIAAPSLILLNLAGVLTEDQLTNALNEARVRRQVTDAELDATLAAHPRRRGARTLRRVLASERARFTVESEAETLCLRLMLEHDLTPDATQAEIGSYRGRLPLSRRASLMALGYVVFPVTWTDLTTQPEATMRRLARALAARCVELDLVGEGS